MSTPTLDSPSAAAGADAISAAERRKYEAMWAHAEYRDDHVTAIARDAMAALGAAAGESLIDFGSGAGYASVWFQQAGLRVLAMDIADNALAPEVRGRVPILLGSFWDTPVRLAADWGFCSDVMEHIPTDRVDAVLGLIRRSTARATWFCISTRPDGCGRLIGETLHLTVRDGAWWIAQIERHWASTRVVLDEPGQRIVLVAEGERAAAAPGVSAAPASPSALGAIYAERMTTLAQTMAAAGVRECLIFGSADAGRALARVAPAYDLRVVAFVRSQEVAPGERVDGIPVLSLAAASAGLCHTYALGSFGSAPAMIGALEAAYAGGLRRYRVFLPEGPAPR